MRSRNGFVERIMRSTQASTRSTSSAFGSSAAPPFVGAGPTSEAPLLERIASMHSSSFLPVQAALSAAVGPKPVRQKMRSTMTGESNVSGVTTTPPAVCLGGTWVRWRRLLTCRWDLLPLTLAVLICRLP